ncbi:NAD(P)H-quinone oxidoreductase subunit I, chloroplastic, partial [Cucurbita argyrosperma subsp. argyrosperma]
MTDTCRFEVLVLFLTFVIRRPTFLGTSRQDPTRRHGQAGKFCHAICLEESNKFRIHFEFDKCIACEVYVRVSPIDLPVVNWKLETDIRKKRLLNYSIDFGICIFCGNCVEYCPTNCLSMTGEYELSTYDRHELNYNQISWGRELLHSIDLIND